MTWRPDMARFLEHVIATFVGPQWAADAMSWLRGWNAPVAAGLSQSESDWVDWVSRRYDVPKMTKAPAYIVTGHQTINGRADAAGTRIMLPNAKISTPGIMVMPVNLNSPA